MQHKAESSHAGHVCVPALLYAMGKLRHWQVTQWPPGARGLSLPGSVPLSPSRSLAPPAGLSMLPRLGPPGTPENEGRLSSPGGGTSRF